MLNVCWTHTAYKFLSTFEKTVRIKCLVNDFWCITVLWVHNNYYGAAENAELDIARPSKLMEVANCDHSRTCLPNLVNYGPQMAKMGPFFKHTQNELFRTLISQAKGRCCLRISQFVEDDQHHIGMGLPRQFLRPKIRKLAKNLMHFGLNHRRLLGELHQTVLLDVIP